MDNQDNANSGWELSPHLCTTDMKRWTNCGYEEGDEISTYGTRPDWKRYTQHTNVVGTEGTWKRIRSRKVGFKFRKNGTEKTLYTARTTITEKNGEQEELERSSIVKVKKYGKVRTKITVKLEEASSGRRMEDGVSESDLTPEIIELVDMGDGCGDGTAPVRVSDGTRLVRRRNKRKRTCKGDVDEDMRRKRRRRMYRVSIDQFRLFGENGQCLGTKDSEAKGMKVALQ